MVLRNLGVLIAVVLSFGSIGQAATEKMNAVRHTLKQQCGRSVNDETARELVKRIYLTCVPGTEVSVNGCKIKCHKRTISNARFIK